MSHQSSHTILYKIFDLPNDECVSNASPGCVGVVLVLVGKACSRHSNLTTALKKL